MKKPFECVLERLFFEIEMDRAICNLVWRKQRGSYTCNVTYLMRKNYVLIDYENVQPECLEVLNQDVFNVVLFVGDRQSKIPFEIADAMQRMGQRAEYVRISGNGNNALGFHIAFYIGYVAGKEPDAFFHIISKDTGFDPLLSYLKKKKICAGRWTEIAEIPLLKKPLEPTPQERAELVVEKMKVQAARPRTVKTLGNHVNSLFKKALTEKEIAAVINALKKLKFIAVQENKVNYPA